MTKFDLTWEKTWRNRTHPEDDRPFLNMNREVSLQCQDTSLQKVDVTNDVNKSFIIQMFSKVMLQPCPYHDGFKKWFFNVKFVLKENCRKFILGVTKYLKKVSWRQVTFGYKKNCHTNSIERQTLVMAFGFHDTKIQIYLRPYDIYELRTMLNSKRAWGILTKCQRCFISLSSKLVNGGGAKSSKYRHNTYMVIVWPLKRRSRWNLFCWNQAIGTFENAI